MSTQPTPGSIADHPNGCQCQRCDGLEVCPYCGQQKLDIDWCFSCKRLVFAYVPVVSDGHKGGT